MVRLKRSRAGCRVIGQVARDVCGYKSESESHSPVWFKCAAQSVSTGALRVSSDLDKLGVLKTDYLGQMTR